MSLLHSTDQTTYGDIVAFVNACFTASTLSAMEPDWLLLELSPQHPDVNAFILRDYVEAAHRVHQASMLNLLEEESDLALRDGVHLGRQPLRNCSCLLSREVLPR